MSDANETDPAAWPTHAVRLKDGTPGVLRPATPDDAAAIVAMLEAAYLDGEGTVGLPGEIEWSVEGERERIARDRATGDVLCLIAVVGAVVGDGAGDDVGAGEGDGGGEGDGKSAGDVVGVIRFERGRRRRLRHQGEFGLWVAPAWRSRGVGRRLLEAVIAWARKQGIERIGLTVLGDALRAIGLYRSLGFAEEGRRVRQVKDVDGRYVDQVQMALFLS